jgi:hypothetical protein
MGVVDVVVDVVVHDDDVTTGSATSISDSIIPRGFRHMIDALSLSLTPSLSLCLSFSFRFHLLPLFLKQNSTTSTPASTLSSSMDEKNKEIKHSWLSYSVLTTTSISLNKEYLTRIIYMETLCRFNGHAVTPMRSVTSDSLRDIVVTLSCGTRKGRRK